jgi:hypothetical protein
VPSKAFISSRATRRLCSVLLTLSLCAVAGAPAASATSATGPAAPVAHAAQSPQRAQERAERKLQREALRQQRKAARLQRREARRAEREARQATRASRRAERAGGPDTPGEAPTTSEERAPSEGQGEAPKGEAGAPGSAGGRGPCTLSAQASSPQVTAGSTVTISGKLTCPSPLEAGGQEVTVSQRGAVAATSGLAVAGTVITQPDGSYELQSTELTGRSVFIARSPNAQREARVLVTVGGVVDLQGPAATGASLPMGAGKSAGGPAKQTFTGTVAPAEAGRQVALDVRYGSGEWRTVAFTRTDAQGNFSFSHRFRFAGEVSVMASARPRGDVATRSAALSYTIVQAQNPAVTIALALAPAQAPLAPADGLASGEPVTVAGVATRCAQHTVTLLVRSPAGGSFTAQATMQADATGAYSFTVAPTETTVYAVKCGRSRSTLVRREVLSSPPAAPAS